jgi:hypothetical protein
MPIAHNTCLFVGRQGPDAFSDPDLLLRAGFSGSKGFPHAAYIPVAIIATTDESAMKLGRTLFTQVRGIGILGS